MFQKKKINKMEEPNENNVQDTQVFAKLRDLFNDNSIDKET